ncbi:hypothetical protein ACER0A_003675 [Haloimpatiens sp. FM7315]|uniref:hypothetical protein n=1 Tax=Haloimpatiens sp. FM7315 TaxID=3298609 RepID=UPI0035A32A90
MSCCYKESNLLKRELEKLFCENCCDMCLCPCGCNCVNNICQCCACPMQSILTTLKNRAVKLTQVVLADGTMLSGIIVINEVSDFKVKLVITGTTPGTFDIPICQITRLETKNDIVEDLVIVSPPTTSCGQCMCCEQPMRYKLEELHNAETDIAVFALGIPSEIGVYREILTVDMGLLITKYTANPPIYSIYSICKITGVQENV